MSLAEAFAPAQDHYRNQVMHATWGHLAPQQDNAHAGSFVFTIAGYGGDMVIITSDFPTVDDSPWFYQHMQNFMGDYIRIANETGREYRGHVFRFDGAYMMKSNRVGGSAGEWKGKVRRIDLT
jgi:hypothetical protein